MSPSLAFAREQLSLWSGNGPLYAEALGHALREEKWDRRMGRRSRCSSWGNIQRSAQKQPA